MGSSTASETTINTSTDSANTMVTMVTTTDGEQHDDSLDLIDVLPELSPPPVNDTTAHSTHHQHSNGGVSVTVTAQVSVVVTSTSPQQQQQPSPPRTNENGLPNSQVTKGVMNHVPSTNPTTVILQNGHGNGSSSSSTTSTTNFGGSGGTDSPGAPPPTPLVGSHQESRFTFCDQRIKPALPDLRTADFFSQPVRGSVDAGQPDPQQISSMLALVAAKNSCCSSIPNGPSQSPSNGCLAKVNGERSPTESSPTSTTTSSSTGTTAKPNINVTTNPLDISLCTPQTPSSAPGTRAGRGGRAAESHPLVSTIHSWVRLFFPFCAIGGNTAGGKRTAQATIVVQQPSLSLDAPAATILLRTADADARRREENMKQLLDVANTLTLQEIHEFEKKYGSPHHSRSQSVRTPGSRASGRPNYLCLPQQRSRVASMPNTGVEEEYYRLRHFSITTKGVVNRGDSLKSRRSRSNNSVASSNSSTEHLTASYPGSARNSAAGSLASSRESSASQGPAPYRVLMLGASAVGKSSLVSQFMTSEYLHAYDTSIDDESGEKTVSVLLAGEESELTFIDHPCSEMTPENCIATYEPHGYCVVYSTTDRSSVRVAEEVLQNLWRSDHIPARAVILVGNKVDLVRSRLVSTEEGKTMAISYDCKFIETSVGINHNVDELLVGLLTQIRLKLENPERNRDLFKRRNRRNRSRSPLGSCSENNSPKKYRNSRTSTSLKVRNLLGKVWARDSKSKSCENLHVL
ncbi:probable serine/threonine-protein kinase nek3 isoform X3 [Nasonia vitripennis]|uniref:GTP-binding protein RAD n=1 Tax=Nasonia vitripennis TaxID=7425 RepID=A0A7M7TBI0_NASVI|nr:probable serine/threonine-protein kinase nek3 isoform X3 [Nasonia vitripennis]